MLAYTADKNANSLLQCIYKWKGNISNPVGNLANQQINGTLFHVIFRFVRVFLFFFLNFFFLLHQATRQTIYQTGMEMVMGVFELLTKKKERKKLFCNFTQFSNFMAIQMKISYSYNTTVTTQKRNNNKYWFWFFPPSSLFFPYLLQRFEDFKTG